MVLGPSRHRPTYEVSTMSLLQNASNDVGKIYHVWCGQILFRNLFRVKLRPCKFLLRQQCKSEHHTVEDDNSFSLPKKRSIFSSRFQYSERTIHSTERNFTSAESSWSQLFGSRRTRAWHCQKGTTPTFRKKQISFFPVMKMEDAQYRDLPL